MRTTRIVVVDDSAFSVAVLRNMLTDAGYEVIGEASSLEETVQVVSELHPDLVTMDMTMPGTDGLECTKAIHGIDPNIKVIIVSSMMDDEIVRKAKKINVSGYVQKPVDPEELTLLINRIMADEELFKELEDIYFAVYKESVGDTFNRLVKIAPEFQQEKDENVEWVSRGISVVMGIIGKYVGRMIIDISYDTARKLAAVALKREPKDLDEVLNFISEFSNIAAGNACSTLNRRNKLFGLRVAPPTIFHGESVNISKAELDTTKSAAATMAFGGFNFNVGFKRGTGEWMSGI